MTTEPLGFIHRFEPGAKAGRPLLLLHGTGGDETDLLPLGRTVAPAAPLLSPRGQVCENGMPRFFRRVSEGVFDEADLHRRAHELADFLTAARKRYRLGAPIALGYSNGANMASAVLLLRPEALAGAVLLRPMIPFAAPPRANLGAKPVLIISGGIDPIVPAENAAGFAQALRDAGAAVEHRVLPAGHSLSQADVSLAKAWFDQRSSPAGMSVAA